MRLWHYKLIPVLPNKMLVSQWRELIAIKRQWEKGTLKHPLVDYIMQYDKKDFMYYTDKVVNQLGARNIKYQNKYYFEIKNFCSPKHYIIGGKDYPEHNNVYFKICCYNLYEKYIRGIISDEEWEPIERLYWQIDDKGYY